MLNKNSLTNYCRHLKLLLHEVDVKPAAISLFASFHYFLYIWRLALLLDCRPFVISVAPYILSLMQKICLSSLMTRIQSFLIINHPGLDVQVRSGSLNPSLQWLCGGRAWNLRVIIPNPFLRHVRTVCSCILLFCQSK